MGSKAEGSTPMVLAANRMLFRAKPRGDVRRPFPCFGCGEQAHAQDAIRQAVRYFLPCWLQTSSFAMFAARHKQDRLGPLQNAATVLAREGDQRAGIVSRTKAIFSRYAMPGGRARAEA